MPLALCLCVPTPQASSGRYVAYEAHPSDAESLGRPLDAYQTRQEALTACKTNSACIGFKFVHTDVGSNPWRTFAGTLWEGATGKVRVTGENIDAWIEGATST